MRNRTKGIVVVLIAKLLSGALAYHHESRPHPTHRYVALYKPALTLCTQRDDQARAQRKNRDIRSTLQDFNLPYGLHISGRLDRDSEGLLILTDDGQFTRDVCEPDISSEVDDDPTNNNEGGCQKKYWALVRGTPSTSALERMRRGGLLIRGAKTRPPVSVEMLPTNIIDRAKLPPAAFGMGPRRGESSWIQIILTEGRNRQVRRMTADAGHPTARLIRISIGGLSLLLNDDDDDDDSDSGLILQPGEWRFIEKEDVLGKVDEE